MARTPTHCADEETHISDFVCLFAVVPLRQGAGQEHPPCQERQGGGGGGPANNARHVIHHVVHRCSPVATGVANLSNHILNPRFVTYMKLVHVASIEHCLLVPATWRCGRPRRSSWQEQAHKCTMCKQSGTSGPMALLRMRVQRVCKGGQVLYEYTVSERTSGRVSLDPRTWRRRNISARKTPRRSCSSMNRIAIAYPLAVTCYPLGENGASRRGGRCTARNSGGGCRT